MTCCAAARCVSYPAGSKLETGYLAVLSYFDLRACDRNGSDTACPDEIGCGCQIYSGRIVVFLAKPYPDLALLQCDALQDHPCVYLHADIALHDSLYSYGYTDEYPRGDSATFEYEGPTDTDSGRLRK